MWCSYWWNYFHPRKALQTLPWGLSEVLLRLLGDTYSSSAALASAG